MKENELKPCPFCGNDLMEYYGMIKNNIQCVACCAKIVGISKDEAIEKWNTRSTPKDSHNDMRGVHDGLCFICNEKTNSYGGDPSMWGFFMAHIDGQGKHRFYHLKCLYPILKVQKLDEGILSDLKMLQNSIKSADMSEQDVVIKDLMKQIKAICSKFSTPPVAGSKERG